MRSRIVRVPDQRNSGDTWNRLSEELEPLAADLRAEQTHAGDIAAGLGETGYKPKPKRISTQGDDRNRFGFAEGRACCLRAVGYDGVDFEGDQFGCKSVQLAWRFACAPIFDE